MTATSDTATPTGMLKYALVFGLVLLCCQVAVVVVTSMLQVDAPSSMGIIVIMASLAFVAQKFVMDHKRPLLSSERLRLATLGAVVTVAVAAAFQALAAALLNIAGEQDALREVIRELTIGSTSPAFAFALLAALTFVLAWIVIFASVGFMTRGALKRLDRGK